MTDRPKCLRTQPPPGARVSRKQNPETGVMNSIVEAVGLERDFKIYRNNVGQLKDRYGNYVRYGLVTGSSDFVGILGPHGRWVCWEVKVPGEEPTPEQAAWLALMRSLGAFACCVHGAVEARAALDRARAGGSE